MCWWWCGFCFFGWECWLVLWLLLMLYWLVGDWDVGCVWFCGRFLLGWDYYRYRMGCVYCWRKWWCECLLCVICWRVWCYVSVGLCLYGGFVDICCIWVVIWWWDWFLLLDWWCVLLFFCFVVLVSSNG